MREIFIGFLAGVIVATGAGAALLRARMASPTAPSQPGETATTADAPSSIPSEKAQLESRLSTLRARLGEEWSAGREGDPDRPPSDRDVSRWLMGALGEGGPMTRGDAASEDWINGTLEWLADERGINQADLEFGPLRERFIVEFLEKRGVGLSADQKKEFEKFLEEAEAAFGKHLADTTGKPDEERLISGLKATRDWEDRLAGILKPEQLAKLGDLDVLIDQWRWVPACEPKLIDPEDPDSALESARLKLNPGDYDRARPILVEHVKALVAMHREVAKARMENTQAVSAVDEFIRYMEIRVQTRKRLVEEAGLRVESIPPQFLMDYEGPKEAGDE